MSNTLQTVQQMSIQERQNLSHSLTLLAAQRQLYSRAKRMRNVAITIVLGVATLGLVGSMVDSQQFTQFFPSVVLLSWLFDQRVLATRERDLRTEAATIQEAFDCLVLDLSWPSYRGIQPPTTDRVRQLAAAAKDVGTLKNWYPPNAIPVDPMLAKLHCQRTNCWWDVSLRRKWRSFLWTVLWGLFVLLIVVSAATGLTVAKVVAILASNIRVMAWGLSERDKQASAIERVADIHSFVSSFGAEQPPSAADVRGVQDAVFDHRRSTPPLPDWFYWWHRETQEREAGGGSDC